jgi:hypothetical protein
MFIGIIVKINSILRIQRRLKAIAFSQLIKGKIMIEANMIEIDGFNMGQIDDNCWGFNSYEYTLPYEMEEDEEDEY